MARFQLQVQEGFWFYLRWVPTHENADADSMTQLGIEEFVLLRPEGFQPVCNRFGPFQYGLMATASSAQRVPVWSP